MECKYQKICKFYNNYKPKIYDRSLGLSNCWKYNCLEGILKKEVLPKDLNSRVYTQ